MLRWVSTLLIAAFVVATVIALAPLCVAMQKKGKPPEVVILEIICRRSGVDVVVDGRLKIGPERPVKKLQLLIDFLGADHQLLQTKRGEVNDDVLQKGEEAEFHMRVTDPIRAVEYSIRAEEGDGRELRVDRTGRYPIE
ncbi:MAG: hypothetical protein HY820_00525 [Acidobacteria bacterium]|nr:hypothetical protein [Acidobacteriota bacterium]